MKNDLKHTPTIDLVHRLNKIDVERQNLDIEYNQIIYELCDRIPTLKEDENIQPKSVQKKIGGLGYETKNNRSN